MMGVKLGPAGVPLSCKGRTIVEGMDDIIALGLETMEHKQFDSFNLNILNNIGKQESLLTKLTLR